MLFSLSFSIPTQSRQAEVEDLFYINSYCKVKNLNKVTLPTSVSTDPGKKATSPPAVTPLFKNISTDLQVEWTLTDYGFLYVC